MINKVPVAIIGAGPYGLSVAAHLAARNIEHRIFGRPMQFWSKIADAGGERYLKSYCFGTNLSSPTPGYSFANYNGPRGLETFEPCSMGNFATYGQWFQQNNVPWAEPIDAKNITRKNDAFEVTLTDGERLAADHVVVATGLARFAQIPASVASLPAGLALHTSHVTSFAAFRGKSVAVIGAGQSALEGAALLHEAGAYPHLLVRGSKVLWHHRVHQNRSLWKRLRSPIAGLGAGPKAWALTHFPGAVHRLPDEWRTRFVKRHLPAEGAWWLRERVEGRVPVSVGTSIASAREVGGRVQLSLRVAGESSERQMEVDHVIAGSGFDINVDRMEFIDAALRSEIVRLERSPRLNSSFESSVSGLHFVGPTSAMSFGPLFRFVVGSEYTAQAVSAHLATQVPAGMAGQMAGSRFGGSRIPA